MEPARGDLVKTFSLSAFKGIDLRNIPESSPADTVRIARNVDLSTLGGFRNRPRLRLHATLDPQSFGLYVADGKLRAAFPITDTGPVPRPPPQMEYDVLAVNDGQYTFPNAVTAIPAVDVFDGRPYLVTESGIPPWQVYSHHYVARPPVIFSTSYTTPCTTTDVHLAAALPAELMTPGWTLWVQQPVPTIPARRVTAVISPTHVQVAALPAAPGLGVPCRAVYPYRTLVSTPPFTPGPAMIVHARRVWASDLTTRDVYFSSIDTATDWTGGDSGNLRTSLHVDGGADPIRGFGVFKGALVVIYERATQTWFVTDYDPEQTFRLVDNVGGAGTKWAKSVANVMGDLYYFSEGGFRSLSAVVTTGQLRESDIGAPLLPITKNLDVADSPPLAVWSPADSKYQCAIGTTHYVLTNSPRSNTFGWTTYELPFEVTALVVFEGRVYLRRRDSGEVYVFDRDEQHEIGYSWEVKGQAIDVAEGTDAAHFMKHVQFVEIHQTGTCSFAVGLSPDDPSDEVEAFTLEGSSTGKGKIPLLTLSETICPRFYGTLDWDLGGIDFRYTVGNLV